MWNSSRQPTLDGRQHLLPRGDLAAFNQQVLAHQARLYTIAYRVLGSHPAAERATQAAVEQAYAHSIRTQPDQAETDLLRCLVAALRRANLDLPPVTDGPLGHLPFSLRLALVLIDVAGLEYERAADALHVSPIELIQQLARARAALIRQPGTAARVGMTER